MVANGMNEVKAEAGAGRDERATLVFNGKHVYGAD